MTKFEEELNSLPVSKSTNYTEYWNKAQLLTVFKDWQPQQALPVVPDYVGNAVMKINLEHLFTGYTNGINEKAKNWLERHKGVKSLGYYVCQLRFQGFTVEKPQLFYLRDELTGQFLAKDNQFKNEDRYFFWTGEDPLTHSIGTAWKLTFTQQEIDSMQTGSYEQIKVEES